MHRISIDPRPNWQKRVEEHGLHHHTLRGEKYWDESVVYQLSNYEVDTLEAATQALHEMCLELVQEVIDERMFGLFLIPKEFEELVIRSWEEKEPSIYGRFDLAYDGVGAPKLLEYNADTPTALVEASVIQWFWLKDVDERGDQFNSIHERLLEAWKAVHERDSRPIHFAAQEGIIEDYVTVEYLRDTAIQAGFETSYLDVEQIGWSVHNQFVDLAGLPIHRCFKLYPWEWLAREGFGKHIPQASTRWIEPAWKMILSCKSILPMLYERHPESPFLLPASFTGLEGGNYVQKPVHAREGANITLVVNGKVQQETAGPYTDCPTVYQQLAPMRAHDGYYPIFGSWVVNGVACGVGIREDDSLITSNLSRFVPHQMVS